jgi:hypothetical protein
MANLKPTLTLREKQSNFVLMIGHLIAWAYANGYELTFGEALRTTAQAAANAKSGAGISNSLHLLKLAVDFQLYINGVYQTNTAAYEPLGKYWESIGGSWGGRFTTRPDGNHFSLEHNGVR